MLHFLVIAFLLPLLSSTLSLGAAGLDRKRLTLGGISFGSIALVELAALFTHPVTWITFLFIVPAALPLATMPFSGFSIAALVVVFFAALLAAQALGNILATSRRAHRISGAFRFIFTAALLVLVASNADFTWDAGTVRISLFQHPTLLTDGAGNGLLFLFRPWSPSVWIFRGWVVPSAALLIARPGLLHAFPARHVRCGG